MDPNANLAEQRHLIRSINAMNDRSTDDGQLQAQDRTQYEADCNRLAELAQALDGWITRGGCLPIAWIAK